MNLRKVARYPVSGLYLLDIFRQGQIVHLEIAQGFPPDAKIVRSFYDRAIDSYFFVVQSEHFPEVPEGCLIPLRTIEVRDLAAKAKYEELVQQKFQELLQKENAANGKEGANQKEGATEGQTDVSQDSQPGAAGT